LQNFLLPKQKKPVAIPFLVPLEGESSLLWSRVAIMLFFFRNAE
jgi:hypothetical protein